MPLDFSGGRWTAKLDTTSLAAGCNTVTATLDGHAAGSFTLDLKGTDPAPDQRPRRQAAQGQAKEVARRGGSSSGPAAHSGHGRTGSGGSIAS